MSRLRRFLSPQVADLVRSGDEAALDSHRREIVVLFCDLRGFTAFAESSEPEEVMDVLGGYHRALGELIHHHEGTLERFTGDGLMVFFNDPVPCDDPAARAVRLALDMRDRVSELEARLVAARARPGLLGRAGAGLRHARPGRLRGPVRLRRHRHASPTWRRGCAPRRRRVRC